ncbi:hypothetical protein GCM10009642_31050 [Nocardiopsis metallicus]|uniref:Polyketide cyclase n=1 Tax=Nocardiopsis metallicus TaxID=179819 RepID=A0A840WDJ4_9ACTN|nr:hypothetical protein [Nocardiopsis metallicus]MBB5495080.1 hypothetical protein [Nocardiopsis metallicus]
MTQPPEPTEPPGSREPTEPNESPEPGRPSEADRRADHETAERYAPGYAAHEESALPSPSRARWILAGVVLAAFAALLAVRVTRFGGLDQTALFYVGLPALLALLVVLCCRARSAVGVAIAVTTVALLLAGPVLGEGMVCLIISAPLIYGMVSLVTWVGVAIVRGGRGSPNALVAVPILFALALEGVGGFSLLPRADTGAGSRLVSAAPADVADALAAAPEYASPTALFLRAVPFPEPVEAVGEGLAVGDTRVIHFTPRRTLAPGAESTSRRMELEIVESHVHPGGGRVVFDVIEDTAFANWMEMERAVATWEAEIVEGEVEKTRLTWEIEYQRTYDPSWYFGPVQSYATGLAAGYLADTFAALAQAPSQDPEPADVTKPETSPVDSDEVLVSGSPDIPREPRADTSYGKPGAAPGEGARP